MQLSKITAITTNESRFQRKNYAQKQSPQITFGQISPNLEKCIAKNEVLIKNLASEKGIDINQLLQEMKNFTKLNFCIIKSEARINSPSLFLFAKEGDKAHKFDCIGYSNLGLEPKKIGKILSDVKNFVDKYKELTQKSLNSDVEKMFDYNLKIEPEMIEPEMII